MNECIWKIAGACHKHCCECEEYVGMEEDGTYRLYGDEYERLQGLLSEDNGSDDI